MGALFSFGLPTMEIASGKEPVAVMFLPSRRFKVVRIKLVDNTFFIINKGGMRGLYQVDATKAWFYEKVACFFYDQRNAKPMDPVLVNELELFARKNKLNKIKHKDVKHGSMLRRFRAKSDSKTAVEQVKNVASGSQEEIDNTINSFFDTAKQQNEEAIKKKQPQPYETELDLTYALTQTLEEKNLLTKDEAMLLEERVRSHTITFDEMINELRTNEIVQIHEPITVDAERFLDDFHTYIPSSVSSVADKLVRIDKGLKTMTSIPVKNWIPASLVIGVAIAIMIGVTVMVQQWPTISKMLPNIMPGATPPHFLLGIKSLLMSKLFS